MPAHIMIGAAEVDVKDVLAFLQTKNAAISFTQQDLLVLSEIVATYTGSLDVSSLKNELVKAGVNYV